MNKKIYRLITSKNYLKLVKIYHSFFGENFKKDIDKQNIYNDKIHRLDVIQNLIKKYNFKKYLFSNEQSKFFEIKKDYPLNTYFLQNSHLSI